MRTAASLTLAATCALTLILTAGCDREVERTLGRMTAQSVESQYQVVDDPLIAGWVDLHGHMLVAYTVRQSIPYQFRVLRTDMVNAFAAPYGYIYLTTGLLQAAETEDEVLGVLGHEIGHVTHRHGMSQAKRSFLYNIGLAVLGGSDEDAAEIAGIGLGLLSLRYSRKNEYQADDMGRGLSMAAGYDPHGVVDFFRKLMDKHDKDRPSRIEVMVRTHPPTQRRITRQQAMPELSEQNPTSLLQIGRGYIRRHHYRRGAKILAKAAQLSPTDPTTLVALGDAQLARGNREKALRSYQMAQQLSPRPYAERAAKAASTPPSQTTAAASGAQRRIAANALTDATSLRNRANSIAAQTQSKLDAHNAQLETTARNTSSTLEQLIGLSGHQAAVGDTAQQILTFANAAVNEAADPLYSLETDRKDIRECSQQLQELSSTLLTQFRDAAAGGLPGPDVNVLRRTLAEARRALTDVDAAVQAVDDAQPTVITAQRQARQTAQHIARIIGGHSTSMAMTAAHMSAQSTRNAAQAAKQAADKADQVSKRASLRTLVARINSAAIGTTARQRQNLDGLVAHYLLAEADTVENLRQRGIGYGDAAVLLAASKSLDTPPDEAASGITGLDSVVDHMYALGAKKDGALVLLEYLARAIEYETGPAQDEE